MPLSQPTQTRMYPGDNTTMQSERQPKLCSALSIMEFARVNGLNQVTFQRNMRMTSFLGEENDSQAKKSKPGPPVETKHNLCFFSLLFPCRHARDKRGNEAGKKKEDTQLQTERETTIQIR